MTFEEWWTENNARFISHNTPTMDIIREAFKAGQENIKANVTPIIQELVTTLYAMLAEQQTEEHGDEGK